MEYLYASIMAVTITVLLYHIIGWARIQACMTMWLKPDYWTSYNTVEFLAWFTKAAVIVPGLLFGMEIWWLHILTLGTSAALIWASERKLLPTLVAFNTLWILISSIVIVRHVMGLSGA